jgi:IS66 Orf2 like protein
MRVLYFAGDGFCLWSKRLERGQFQVSSAGGKKAIDYSAWQMIVDGIDLRTVRRLKRYQKKSPTGSTADLGFSSISPHERGRDNGDFQGSCRVSHSRCFLFLFAVDLTFRVEPHHVR